MGNLNRIDSPSPAAEYDTDFSAWVLDQAARLRAAQVPGLDTVNLAEEIESLAARDKRELASRLAVLLMHLLKWQYQPGRRGESWLSTIDEQRLAIELVLADSPSLRPALPGLMTMAYLRAVKRAARETGMPTSAFPAACPWRLEDILDEDWMPA